MSTCENGCTTRGQHDAGCTCTNECPDHEHHCTGCLPRTIPTGHIICGRCTQQLREHLNRLPDLAAAVAARRDGALNMARLPNLDGIHAPSIEPRSPSPAWDAAEEVIAWAHAWAESLADYLRHAGPFKFNRAGIPTRALTTSITYLTRHLGDIAASPFALDITGEARAMTKRLEKQAGRDELTHRLREPCPSCDHRTLIRRDGSDRVECRNTDCLRIWNEDEYAHLAHVAAS
ncbi:MAG: hypothetical protein ACTHQ3_15865 [Motilibacteraceae bacterium]